MPTNEKLTAEQEAINLLKSKQVTLLISEDGFVFKRCINAMLEFTTSQQSRIEELEKDLLKTNNILTEQGKMYYELNQIKESIQHERDCYYDDTVSLQKDLNSLGSQYALLQNTLIETQEKLDKYENDYSHLQNRNIELKDKLDALQGKGDEMHTKGLEIVNQYTSALKQLREIQYNKGADVMDYQTISEFSAILSDYRKGESNDEC